MSKKDDEKLLDHNYDGIQELDNPLPSWWLLTFYGGIICGIIYFAYFQLAGGPTLQDEFRENMSHHKVVKQKYLDELSNFDSEKFDSILKTSEMTTYGKSIFDANCLACHAKDASGDIGPNLTDEYWLFADGTAESIFPFILTGNPSAGMPAWGEYLSEDELYSVLSYIMSIQGTKHAKAKEPQGEHFPRK